MTKDLEDELDEAIARTERAKVMLRCENGCNPNQKEKEMKTVIGKEGLTKTHQEDFPEIVECVHLGCDGDARIAFVSYEAIDSDTEPKKLVCELHQNNPEDSGFWPHDCCAVAVYFCNKCLGAVALMNQA